MLFTFPVGMHFPVVSCLEHDYRILRFTGCGLYGCFGFVVILGLFIISGIADSLPVVSCVFWVNSLIINSIHFCWFACFLSESGFTGF